VFSTLQRLQLFLPLAYYTLPSTIAAAVLQHGLEFARADRFETLHTPVAVIGENVVGTVDLTTKYLDFIG
jgi:hypothetical protein